MANPKAIKNEIAGKAKRRSREVLGDQKLHDKGNTQERQAAKSGTSRPTSGLLLNSAN